MDICSNAVSPKTLSSNIRSVLKFMHKRDVANPLKREVEWYLATCEEIDQMLTEIKSLDEQTYEERRCDFCSIAKDIMFYLDSLIYDEDNQSSWRHLVFSELVIKHRAARKLYHLLRDKRVYHLEYYLKNAKKVHAQQKNHS